jgi:hypothetical protein
MPGPAAVRAHAFGPAVTDLEATLEQVASALGLSVLTIQTTKANLSGDGRWIDASHVEHPLYRGGPAWVRGGDL